MHIIGPLARIRILISPNPNPSRIFVSLYFIYFYESPGIFDEEKIEFKSLYFKKFVKDFCIGYFIENKD